MVRITYFHNATVINTSAFLVQPLIFNLFSLGFQAHLSSRVYTFSRIILYQLAQTIMLLRNMFDYNIWLTLFLSTEVFNFDLGRANRIFHQSSVQWMISTSSVVIPRATWHLRPSHGVSTPIWLSLNCYCFAPHHKSLSVLSLVSVSPKIISRCICRMLLYMRKFA